MFKYEDCTATRVTQKVNKWSTLRAKFIKCVCTTRELNNMNRPMHTIKSFTNKNIKKHVYCLQTYIFPKIMYTYFNYIQSILLYYFFVSHISKNTDV